NIEYRYQETETLFLDIFDSVGRKILMKQYSNVSEIRETIDVTGMAQGIYYLRLRSNQQQLLRQIVIY
ncbi:MAG: T9SS type A sorting domain-containing protein, partial [Bacteroidia bacterium]